MSDLKRRIPTQARSIQRVEAILDAASQVLQTEGYAKTSTNRIARDAGIPIGSLYQYFSSKEEIIAALIDRQAATEFQLLRGMLEQSENLSIESVAENLVKALIEVYQQNPDLRRVIEEEVPRAGELRHVHDTDVEAAELIADFLEKRKFELAVQDCETAAFVVLHAVESVIHQAINYRRDLLEDERLAKQAVRLMLNYLVG